MTKRAEVVGKLEQIRAMLEAEEAPAVDRLAVAGAVRARLAERRGLAEAGKGADSAEVRQAKKAYMGLFHALGAIREMQDALSNIQGDKRAAEANDDLSKALKILDHAAETMRLMGLQKA